MLKIKPRRSDNERCAYCHGDEDTPNSGLELVVCLGCQATMHIECRAEAPRCTTMGCNWRHSSESIDYSALVDTPSGQSVMWRMIDWITRCIRVVGPIFLVWWIHYAWLLYRRPN